MKTAAIFLGIIFIALVPNLYAQSLPELTEDMKIQLLPTKHAVQALEDTMKTGVLTKEQFGVATKKYLLEAEKIASRHVSLEEILSVPEPAKLTGLQKFAGLVAFINILWVLSICFGVFCLSFIMIDWFKALPGIFYETALYLAGASCVYAGLDLGLSIREYIALTGCLLVTGGVSVTHYLHNHKGSGSWESLIVAVFSGVVAVIYASNMVGFVAVTALMSALGFSMIITPLCYGIGFRDEDAVSKATSAAFVILSVYVGSVMFGWHLGKAEVFMAGALWMGSFVGYLGLLIASSKWYHSRNYALRQIVTVCAGLLALYIGSVAQIGELQKIGGTLFVLYVIEKLMEIPAKNFIEYCYLGLFISGLLYGFCAYVKAHAEAMKQFLFF